MESKYKLKKIDIKNRMCYYFHFDFTDILLKKKSYENILIYIPHKTFLGARSLRIWFEKIDGFIKMYDGIRYLVLFGPEQFDGI